MLTATLAALALAAGPLDFEGSVAAGGGYDSNLSHQSSKALEVGEGYGAARATGGASLDVTDSTNLYAGLRLEGETYPRVSGLSTGSLGLEAALIQDLSESVALVLSPMVSQSWYGDRARDTTLLAAKLTVRVRPVDPLALRAWYGHKHADASDPAFSYDRDAVGLSVELRLAPGTYLTLADTLEFGQDVFYSAVAGGGGMMGGVTMNTFDRLEQAFRAAATSNTIGPSLELGLGGDAFLEASYALKSVRSSAGDYQSHELSLGLGWRI